MPEGQKDVSVGTPVLVLVDDESALDKFKDYQPSAGGGSAPAKSEEPEEEAAQASATSSLGNTHACLHKYS